MFTWKKIGKIFDPRNYTNTLWFNEFSQTPNTLIFDNFVRVYFTTRMKKDEHGRLKSLIGYFDLDKNNLTKIINISKKPILSLGKRGFFDEFGTYLLAPIREKNVIRGYYAGFTCLESVPFKVSIGLAESHDNGETFQKIGNGPVLGDSLYDPFIVSSHKIRKYNNKYYLFYTSGVKWLKLDSQKVEPIYKIKMASSLDGIHWERYNQYIIPDKLNENEAQACPDITYHNGKYHMFFCYREAIDYRKNPKNSYRIGYASSIDLFNWKRDDTKAGIDISLTNDFDNEMVAYPHVFNVNNQFYMLYVGNEVGRYGIGLAKLEGELL